MQKITHLAKILHSPGVTGGTNLTSDITCSDNIGISLFPTLKCCRIGELNKIAFLGIKIEQSSFEHPQHSFNKEYFSIAHAKDMGHSPPKREMGRRSGNPSVDDGKKAIRRETNVPHTSPQGLAKWSIATKVKIRFIKT